MSNTASGRVTLSFADCWFLFVPPICWSAIVTVLIVALIEGVHPAWWILDDSRRHALMLGAVLLNNLTCFTAVWSLWKLPLNWKRRLQAILWTMLLSSFAVPMWRVAVHPHRENAAVLSESVEHYVRICFRLTLVVVALILLIWLVFPGASLPAAVDPR